eukprot:g29432.t1
MFIQSYSSKIFLFSHELFNDVIKNSTTTIGPLTNFPITVSSLEQQPCTISLEGNKHAQRLLVVQAVPQKKSKHQRRAKKMPRKLVDEADVPSADRKQPERAAKKYRDHVADEEEDEEEFADDESFMEGKDDSLDEDDEEYTESSMRSRKISDHY